MGKLWLLLAVAMLLTAFGGNPMQKTDLSRVSLVQTMVISEDRGQIRVDCGEKLSGQGGDLEAALEDLKARAEGDAFFATAQNIVLCQTDIWDQLIQIPGLRPAAELYQAEGAVEAQAVNAFLMQHPSGVTLLDLKRAQLYEQRLAVPGLQRQEGGYRIVDGKSV